MTSMSMRLETCYQERKESRKVSRSNFISSIVITPGTYHRKISLDRFNSGTRLFDAELVASDATTILRNSRVPGGTISFSVRRVYDGARRLWKRSMKRKQKKKKKREKKKKDERKEWKEGKREEKLYRRKDAFYHASHGLTAKGS